MADRRAGAFAVGAVLGLVVLLGCVVAIGAAAGSGDVLTGKGHRTEHRVAPSHAVTAHSDPRSKGPDHRRDRPLPDWLGWVVVAVVAGAAAVLGYGLWTVIPRDLRRIHRSSEPPPAEESATDPEAVAHRLRAAADEQLAALEVGDPRNAIVACWHSLERLFEEAGAARQPWETSTEFTVRVLREIDADPDGVRRLAALYREARFSEHPIGEEQREQARSALVVVQAGLVAADGRGSR